MILCKICIAIGLAWVLTCGLSACTMTLSIDTLEAGSRTSSTWQKSSASESRNVSGVGIVASQGQSLAIDQLLENEAARGLKSDVSSRYLK